MKSGKVDATRCREMIEAFLFDGLSPSNKKKLTLRSLRLCGENPVFDNISFPGFTSSFKSVILKRL